MFLIKINQCKYLRKAGPAACSWVNRSLCMQADLIVHFRGAASSASSKKWLPHCDPLMTLWTRIGNEFIQSRSWIFSMKVTSAFTLQRIEPQNQQRTLVPSYTRGNESPTKTICDDVPSTALQSQLDQICLVQVLQRSVEICWLPKCPCITTPLLLCCRFSFLFRFFPLLQHHVPLR